MRLREKGPEPEPLKTDDDTVRSAARTELISEPLTVGGAGSIQ